MADIFISYASEDRERVRPLADALRRRGFKVWWDRGLAAGQDYTAVIERELDAAKAVVVVWTAGSISSTFVRDEAARARDSGRIVPVLMDRVELPLGFASYQAEDFTRWTGAGNAPQIQILDETLRARVSGRDVDSAKIAHKRRRLMARVRVISLLTVVFLLVGIAVGAKLIMQGPAQHAEAVDPRVQLLRLLEEGKLTPDQAIELAHILEPQALGGLQTVSVDQALPADPQVRVNAADGSPAAQALFASVARASYTDAMAALLLAPEARVRQAAVQMADPAQRDAAIQTLWDYAQAHPDLRRQIYFACGVVGEANGNALAPQALAYIAQVDPRNAANWLMLAHAHNRLGQTNDAILAALISEALTARTDGDAQTAEQSFAQALPRATEPTVRAFVASQLGELAEERQDFTSASARYAAAYRASEQAVAASADEAASAALQLNAQQLVRALDRSGRTRDACMQLQRAQVDHDIAAPEGDLVQRCAARFHVQLRPAGN
ncbi:MAG TPA: toll/interleukin-1 receptor domain-containing protein [Caulobacterales bacterium]|nr:toll/interleukin-1 receptor domain-containing protein [Caulobacterales bacterium]